MNYPTGYYPAAPGYVAPQPYPYQALAAPYYGGMAVFGADPADTRTTTQKAKDWLNAETAGVPRKYLVAGAGAIALLVAGTSAGWFATRRRR